MASVRPRPFIIYRPAPGAGFWSNFSCVLQGLDHADQNELLPVVDMERHLTHYNEPETAWGTKNAWEYYFAQPGALTLGEAIVSDPLEHDGSKFGRYTNIPQVIPPAHLVRRARGLIKKYVRVLPQILAEVDALLPTGVHEDVLGIHVRGTDMRAGFAPQHPVSAHPIMYFDQAVTLDKEFRFSQVVLACDEEETLQLFRSHFTDRLVAAGAHRLNHEHVVEETNQWLLIGERAHHRSLLGREVLRDALMLARCGHFVCGVSNVSQCAIYFSSSDQQVHAVPPVWWAPEHRGPSLGRNHLVACEPYSRTPTAQAREIHLKELQRLLQTAENSLGEVLREKDTLESRLAGALSDVANGIQSLDGARTLLKEERSKGHSLALRLQKALAILGELKQRIKRLLSSWTRLGWCLLPWTSPSWKNAPFAKASSNSRAAASILPP